MDVNKSSFGNGNNNNSSRHEIETIVNEFNVMEDRFITKHNNFPYLYYNNYFILFYILL